MTLVHPFSPLRLLAALLAASLLMAVHSPRLQANFIEDWIASFADTEIEFQRSDSNVPFFPIAYVDLSRYNETEVRREDESSLEYDLTSISQAAVLPFTVGKRDAVFIGEWINLSRFDAVDSDETSFNALTIGIPFGWFGQVSDDKQAAAFLMPLGHRTDISGSDWSHEVMGGVFGRYISSKDFWWAYGFFFDVGLGDDLYLPYLGAAWDINNEVTISAILPWPAVLYAPDRDTLYRFGARPSGASWVLEPDDDELYYNLDTWRLGASADFRMAGHFWFSIEAGLAGLRSLRVEGNDWKGYEFDIDESPYLTVGFNFRPEPP